MPSLQQYKCPCCGGAIEFDSTLQKLKCPFCDTEYEVDTLRSYDAELKATDGESMAWDVPKKDEWHDEGVLVYVCNSCGGEILADDNTAASSCPYCGNPVIMMGKLQGELKPDYIIPFKFDKAAAKSAYLRHISGKKLLPKVFKDENHIDEIKGIYVPYWLFDTKADAYIRYKGTRSNTWRDSKYIYTQTSYFSIYRAGNLEFQNVPVDGSVKMPDDLMESLEPYDFSQAVDFATAYMSGYLADKYDVSSDNAVARANERIKRSTEDAFASTIDGYAGLTTEASSVNFEGGKRRYAFYPVWILNTTWQGNKYTFAMNGQTGKMVGDLPLDKGAYRRMLWGLTAAITAGIFALSFFIHLFV